MRDRIGAFHESAPGARVVKSSGNDQHNGFVRYGWDIVDPQGATVLEGMDVVELDNDGRLHRVVMFFGHFRTRTSGRIRRSAGPAQPAKEVGLWAEMRLGAANLPVGIEVEDVENRYVDLRATRAARSP